MTLRGNWEPKDLIIKSIPMTTKKFVVRMDLFASIETKNSVELSLFKRLLIEDVIRQIRSVNLGSTEWNLSNRAKSRMKELNFEVEKVNLLLEDEVVKELK